MGAKFWIHSSADHPSLTCSEARAGCAELLSG